METSKRQPREEICPGHIIQGNPLLEAVINKSNDNPGVFFEHTDIVNHCNHHCREIAKCTESYKKIIADIFRSYGKEVVEYNQKEISVY